MTKKATVAAGASPPNVLDASAVSAALASAPNSSTGVLFVEVNDD